MTRGDIDIIAVHPREDKKCIACEVKGWHTERLTMSYWKDWPLYLDRYVGQVAQEATS